MVRFEPSEEITLQKTEYSCKQNTQIDHWAVGFCTQKKYRAALSSTHHGIQKMQTNQELQGALVPQLLRPRKYLFVIIRNVFSLIIHWFTGVLSFFSHRIVSSGRPSEKTACLTVLNPIWQNENCPLSLASYVQCPSKSLLKKSNIVRWKSLFRIKVSELINSKFTNEFIYSFHPVAHARELLSLPVGNAQPLSQISGCIFFSNYLCESLLNIFFTKKTAE